MKTHVLIREERFEDRQRVRAVNEAAFSRPDEADLVDRLREDGNVLLSIVAELEERITGHVLFSRMSIQTSKGTLPAVSLAPVAVLPSHQRRQIGSHLIRHGLAELQASGERIVLVLGHEQYYSRFGFSSDRRAICPVPFPFMRSWPWSWKAMRLLTYTARSAIQRRSESERGSNACGRRNPQACRLFNKDG